MKEIQLNFHHKARRISFFMSEGRVGKTTAAFFLAQRLANSGARVLLIDSDAQANLTTALRPGHFGFQLSEDTPVLVDVLSGQCRLETAILKLTMHVHLLPSTKRNTELEPGPRAHTCLDEILQSVDANYDYVIIDCAQTFNVTNAAIIYASDQVILPVPLNAISRQGLKQSIRQIRDLEKQFAFSTSVNILLNRVTLRERLAFYYLSRRAADYRKLLLRTTIRHCAEIKAALSLRHDFFACTKSKASLDFDALTKEILLPLNG